MQRTALVIGGSMSGLLAGLLPPHGGAIAWEGEAIAHDPAAHRQRLHFIGHLDAVKPVLTVREAVRALVHGGMLETRQGAGTYVITRRDPAQLLQQMDYATLAEWLEVRQMLEVEGARLAATRRDAADLKRIQAHLEARGDWHPEQTETTLPAFVERDTNFHLAVMQAGHNQALLAMYRFFSDQWARTIVHTQRDGTLPTPTLQQHRELFEAIADNDTHATVHAVQAMLAPALAAARSRGNDHAPPR